MHTLAPYSIVFTTHSSLQKRAMHTKKVKSKLAQQETAQRRNVSLFGCLYVANQQRDGDLGLFFSHEHQNTPLSDFGNLRVGQKSALFTCIDFSVQTKTYISV